jgi:hypothetical protein
MDEIRFSPDGQRLAIGGYFGTRAPHRRQSSNPQQ